MVDHRRVLGLALKQVGERVAHDVVAVEQRPERRVGRARHDVGAEVALGEPAERAALAVDQQWVGDLDVGRGELRLHLGGRLAYVGQGRLPEVDVGDPHQRQPLQGPVGADEVLDELIGRVHQDLGRGRVLGDLAALAHDRDPVAHLDRLVDVVGDEEDGLADLRLQAEELVLQALAADRVDRAEGLVHQHHQGVGCKRAGDPDALLLAAGELHRVALAELGVEADQLDQLGGAGCGPLLLPAQQLWHGGDVLGDRAVGEEADLLDHVADLTPQPGGVAIAHRLAADQDVALADLDHAVDHPHRRRLAAAGGPDQDADLAGGDLQRQPVDGCHGGIAVALGGAFVADGGGAAIRPFVSDLFAGHLRASLYPMGTGFTAWAGQLGAPALLGLLSQKSAAKTTRPNEVERELVVELDRAEDVVAARPRGRDQAGGAEEAVDGQRGDDHRQQHQGDDPQR